jgi:hypothetical protein
MPKNKLKGLFFSLKKIEALYADWKIYYLKTDGSQLIYQKDCK